MFISAIYGWIYSLITNAVTYADHRHSHSHYGRRAQADLAKPTMRTNLGRLQNWQQLVGIVTGQPPDALEERGAQLMSSTSHFHSSGR